MATIISRDGDDYLLCFSKPETQWILDLAKGMGMTRETVVGAAMNKGLTYYVETFAETEAIDKIKDQIQDEIPDVTSEAKEHKTHDKGSCRG